MEAPAGDPGGCPPRAPSRKRPRRTHLASALPGEAPAGDSQPSSWSRPRVVAPAGGSHGQIAARSHPALRKSRLPPRHMPKPACPGAASPSHAETRFVPGVDLDSRLRQAEQAARAARRASAMSAPARPAWRPLALCPAAVPPAPPRFSPPAALPPAAPLPAVVPPAVAVVPSPGCPLPVALPLPALPPRGHQGSLDVRLPPPPASPSGLLLGTPAYAGWVAASTRAAKRPLSPAPDVHPRGRRIRQRCAASS